MSMEDLFKSLAQTAVQAAESPSGQSAISQMVGGLLGGNQQASAQQGGGQAGQMLGLLEQVIGGVPGSGNITQGAGVNLGASDPVMLLLQPVVNQLATKANIQPQIATVVVSLVVHYLLSNHPSSGRGSNSLDLNSLFQQMSSGNISQSVFHNSGMVNDVMQATGLAKADAIKSLDATFNVLSGHVQGSAGASATSAKSGLKGAAGSGRSGINRP